MVSGLLILSIISFIALTDSSGCLSFIGTAWQNLAKICIGQDFQIMQCIYQQIMQSIRHYADRQDNCDGSKSDQGHVSFEFLTPRHLPVLVTEVGAATITDTSPEKTSINSTKL